MDEIAELRDALDRLRGALDDLAVRGVRAAGPQDLTRLTSLGDEFRGAGAQHIAELLNAAVEAVRANDRSSVAAVLRVMTAVRLFDRFLTLEVAAGLFEVSIAAAAAEAADDSEDA